MWQAKLEGEENIEEETQYAKAEQAATAAAIKARDTAKATSTQAAICGVVSRP